MSSMTFSATKDGDSTIAADDGYGSGPPRPGAGGPLGPGAVIANEYVVVRQIGSGGMGVVYLAHHVELAREVAIKLRTAAGGPTAQRRMLREAQAMARLSHPNVLTVYDVGEHQDAIFIAMEYVPGGTLSQWLKARHRSWREIVRLFHDTGLGLAAAHEAGLIHRDFKPDNVLVGEGGRPRVADFGIARAAPGTRRDISSIPELAAIVPAASAVMAATSTNEGSTPTPEQLHATTDLTQTGVFSGTPAYMAPEQYGSHDIDERADQFSYCVAMWEALYGERPFQGPTAAAVYSAICAGQIKIPPRVRRRRRVPRWLHQLLLRGLSVNPAQRWPSLRALVTELEAQPRRQTTIGLAVGSVLGLCVVAGLAYALGAAEEPEEVQRATATGSGGDADASSKEGPKEAPPGADKTPPGDTGSASRGASPSPEPPVAAPADPPPPGEVARVEHTDPPAPESITCRGPLHIHDTVLEVPDDEAIWAVQGCDLLVERVTFKGSSGIDAGGNAKVVVLDSTFDTKDQGLWIGGDAHIKVARSTIRSAEDEGISVGGNATLELLDTIIVAPTAIYIAGDAQARVIGGEFTGTVNSVSFRGKSFAQRDAKWDGPISGAPARVMPPNETIEFPEPSVPSAR